MDAAAVGEPVRGGRGPQLQTRLHPLTADAEQRAKAQQVARQFEALFVQTMVQDLRKTAQYGGDDEGLFGSGPGADTYAEWFDQHVAEHVSNNGRVGIADVLMRDFERCHQVPKAPPKQAPLPTAVGKGLGIGMGMGMRIGVGKGMAKGGIDVAI